MSTEWMDWIAADCRIVRPWMRVEPSGLVCYPPVGPGRPIFNRLPHPQHPLETIAAMRGMGGLEPDYMWVDCGARLSEPVQNALAYCCSLRSMDWLNYTRVIAHLLFLSPAQVRLAWHVLSPLNVPKQPTVLNTMAYRNLTMNLWEALKDTVPAWWGTTVTTRPFRPNFWTDELEGL